MQKSSQVIAKGEKKNEDGKNPELVRTELVLSKEGEQRSVVHLHYNKWKDRCPVPDEKLLAIMLDEMEKSSPSPDLPITINCHAGIGRTGLTAVSYYLKKQIEAQRLAGKTIHEISVNVPQTIYNFRKFRKILGNGKQAVQVNSVLAHCSENKLAVSSSNQFSVSSTTH